MGRWSRRIAPRFLDWLDAPDGADWLEVGCGTGALSAAIVAQCRPRNLICIDPSEGFLAKAPAHVADVRADFQVGDTRALTFASPSRDVCASELAMTFVPNKE